MQITNSIPDFLSTYETSVPLTLEQLESYYEAYPEIFKQYFPIHCQKSEERLLTAINNYPNQAENIMQISEQLPIVIEEIFNKFIAEYKLDPSIHFKLLVGGYGSNAFVEAKIIGDVYFCAEKLSPKKEHLQIIVSHELGHVYHNVLTDTKSMDWSKIDWIDPCTTLYREGIATYFSMKMVPNQRESVYYSYNDEGEEALAFYYANRREIKLRFLEDIKTGWNDEKEKEWFRLSGGSYFNYNRLGYYLGTDYVRHLVLGAGEIEAITFWQVSNVQQSVERWLAVENLYVPS